MTIHDLDYREWLCTIYPASYLYYVITISMRIQNALRFAGSITVRATTGSIPFGSWEEGRDSVSFVSWKNSVMVRFKVPEFCVRRFSSRTVRFAQFDSRAVLFCKMSLWYGKRFTRSHVVRVEAFS